MTTIQEFGKELQRPFKVDERCYDCVEFYGGCNAQPENRDTRCADYFRLPHGMPAPCGQTFPSSRMNGRKEPRVRVAAGTPVQGQVQPKNPPASWPSPSVQPKGRICGCGVPLAKGRRLCDGCRVEARRQSKRQYMRTYMEQRRSAAVGSASDVPFPATATQSTQAGGGDPALTGLVGRGRTSQQTSVPTNAFQGAIRT
jgi:hypothetical protein